MNDPLRAGEPGGGGRHLHGRAQRLRALGTPRLTMIAAWPFGLPVLTSLAPGWVVMRPSPALALMQHDVVNADGRG